MTEQTMTETSMSAYLQLQETPECQAMIATRKAYDDLARKQRQGRVYSTYALEQAKYAAREARYAYEAHPLFTRYCELAANE